MLKITLQDPLTELLTKFENISFACEIYNGFPDVLAAIKVQLIREIYSGCAERLKHQTSWEAELDPKDEGNQLLVSNWPAMYIVQPSAPGRGHDAWYFGLAIDSAEIPFKPEHGVLKPDDSVLRNSSKKMKQEIDIVRTAFKKHKIKTLMGGWFAYHPYTRCTLGNDPKVLRRALDGSLAGEITDELVTFFDQWSPSVEKLNSLLDDSKQMG